MTSIRIIQFGIDSSNPREFASTQQLQSLGFFYTKIENLPYNHKPPLNNIYQNDESLYVGLTKEYHEFGLTPRHYGCFLGHKQAISLGYCEEGHFLVCEGDCRILDLDLFKERIEEATSILDSTDYPLVRFEEPNNGVSTTFYNQVSPNIWECDQVNTSHCYLVNGKSKEFFNNLFSTVGWHASDWWLNIAFKTNNQKMLCFKEKLTSQYDGFSDIDNVVKTY